MAISQFSWTLLKKVSILNPLKLLKMEKAKYTSSLLCLKLKAICNFSWVLVKTVMVLGHQFLHRAQEAWDMAITCFLLLIKIYSSMFLDLNVTCFLQLLKLQKAKFPFLFAQTVIKLRCSPFKPIRNRGGGIIARFVKNVKFDLGKGYKIKNEYYFKFPSGL